jgi:hypothetical protein
VILISHFNGEFDNQSYQENRRFDYFMLTFEIALGSEGMEVTRRINDDITVI